MELLTNVKKFDVGVTVASGNVVQVDLEGQMGGIKRVLYSKKFKQTLISNADICDEGHAMLYTRNEFYVLESTPKIDGTNVLIKGHRDRKSYQFDPGERFESIGRGKMEQEEMQPTVKERVNAVTMDEIQEVFSITWGIKIFRIQCGILKCLQLDSKASGVIKNRSEISGVCV
jgi:hypothetical protein